MHIVQEGGRSRQYGVQEGGGRKEVAGKWWQEGGQTGEGIVEAAAVSC